MNLTTQAQRSRRRKEANRVASRRHRPRHFRCYAFTLIEMMVYLGVLLVLLSISYAAFYRSLENATAMREGTDDIINTIHAGESWRADVRAARGNIQIESRGADQILNLPGTRGRVSYRFANYTVARRTGNNDWTPVLANVKTSAFVSDSRQNVKAWRWELELLPHSKKFVRIRPLFTFISVPAADQAQ